MAAITRNPCDGITEPSSCENPQFPNWMWRYNRDKHLSRYEPWLIRDERMPPNYRNMGVHSNFRFHPLAPDDSPRPFQMLGVNYCHDATRERTAGFGNSAIGRPPGPAPPRLILYNVQSPYTTDDLCRINEIHNITPGVSLVSQTIIGPTENDFVNLPLNPSHYLDQTLGQPAQIPGTFPHFNKPLPDTAGTPPRLCNIEKDPPRNLMEIWKKKHAEQLASHAREKNCPCPRLVPCPSWK